MNNTLYDKMSMADPQRTSKVSLKVLTGLQSEQPQDQILGVCFLFKTLCDHFEVKPQNCFEMVQRMRQSDEHKESFDAVEAYIEGELK